MRYVGAAYRGHNPKWAFSPASGEGAAVYGARFNPKGVSALYLATTPEGAFLEATQGFSYKFNPLTFVSYECDCDDVVDLTSENARQSIDVDLELMGCAWSEDIANGKRPASWTIYDKLHRSAAGLLVPSFAFGALPFMNNLVLWDWAETPPHMVRIHDPEKRLPKNQDSWR